MDLTPFFESAVVKLNHKQTATLGDRSKYIGSSDVAGCIRKAFLQRVYPTQPNVTTLLKFARGHVAETLIDNIFQAGGVKQLYDTQVELTHPTLPMKAHIDFLFYCDLDGTPELHAIEVKSVSGIPDAPYPQWEDQLIYQLGLLRMHYPNGKLGGSILAIDLNAAQIMQYNGYEHDDATFNYLCCKGQHLLAVMEGEEEARPSPTHLCGYCQYRSDCPAMMLPKVELPPEIEQLAGKYAELNSTKGHAEKEMKAIRQELLDFTGPVFKGRSEKFDLLVSSIATSLSVDNALLKKQYPDVYPMVLKEKSGYTKLEVKPLHRAA
jgi:hypothetical protein